MTEYANVHPISRAPEVVLEQLIRNFECHPKFFVAASMPPTVVCHLTRDGVPGEVLLDFSQRIPAMKLREICRCLDISYQSFGLPNDHESLDKAVNQ